MSMPQLWHGAMCYPRVEVSSSGVGGTTYWSEDEAGRILLHGIEYQGPGYEFYFNPPAVYLDPAAAARRVRHVHRERLRGPRTRATCGTAPFAVRLDCLRREPGDHAPGHVHQRSTVHPDWPDSPGLALVLRRRRRRSPTAGASGPIRARPAVGNPDAELGAGRAAGPRPDGAPLPAGGVVPGRGPQSLQSRHHPALRARRGRSRAPRGVRRRRPPRGDALRRGPRRRPARRRLAAARTSRPASTWRG